MQTENKIVIAFMRAALDEKPFHIEEKEISWKTVWNILNTHKITDMAYFGYQQLENKECVPKEFVERVTQWHGRILVKEAHQHAALEEISEKLEKAGIDFLPLKGSVLKHYYPTLQMRYMGDLDILFKEEKKEEVYRCFAEMGYQFIVGDDVHDEFKREPFVKIEMHKKLVRSPKELYEYFSTIWERVKKTGGTEFRYEMTLEDYYLFMLAHMAKHFTACGTGLRSLADFHVFMKAERSNLNREVLNPCLKKLQLEQFEEFLFEIDGCVFGGKEWTDQQLEQVFEYMMEAGIFGNREYRDVNNVAKEMKGNDSSEVGKRKAMLRMMFLPRVNMELLYPCIKKHGYLLWPMYIYRLFNRVIFSREKSMKKLQQTQVDVGKVDQMQQIQKRAGLRG